MAILRPPFQTRRKKKVRQGPRKCSSPCERRMPTLRRDPSTALRVGSVHGQSRSVCNCGLPKRTPADRSGGVPRSLDDLSGKIPMFDHGDSSPRPFAPLSAFKDEGRMNERAASAEATAAERAVNVRRSRHSSDRDVASGRPRMPLPSSGSRCAQPGPATVADMAEPAAVTAATPGSPETRRRLAASPR